MTQPSPGKGINGYVKLLRNSLPCGPECASARLSTRGIAHLNRGDASCNRHAYPRGGHE